MILDLNTDVYYTLFQKLSLKDIKNMCQVNKTFRNFCIQNSNFIEKLKKKALKVFLQQQESNQRKFALKYKLCFDIQSQILASNRYGMCSHIDKYTFTLLYLINHDYYEEAWILLNTIDKIPEPSLFIFSHPLFTKFPKKLLNIYIQKLPPLLDLFGYTNIDDFIEDFPINNYTNKYFQEYVKNSVK